jgi:hypothetical protein
MKYLIAAQTCLQSENDESEKKYNATNTFYQKTIKGCCINADSGYNTEDNECIFVINERMLSNLLKAILFD